MMAKSNGNNGVDLGALQTTFNDCAANARRTKDLLAKAQAALDAAKHNYSKAQEAYEKAREQLADALRTVIN